VIKFSIFTANLAQLMFLEKLHEFTTITVPKSSSWEDVYQAMLVIYSCLHHAGTAYFCDAEHIIMRQINPLALELKI